MKSSILHYATPPVVGGVESTIYHHSRLLSQAGYDVDVITGNGEQFNQKVSIHLTPEIGSRHKVVSKINQELSRGKIPDDFGNAGCEKIVNALGCIVTNVSRVVVKRKENKDSHR